MPKFQLEAQRLAYKYDTSRMPCSSKTTRFPAVEITDAWEKSYVLADVRTALRAAYQPQDGFTVRDLRDLNLGGEGSGVLDSKGRLVAVRKLVPVDADQSA